MSRVDFYILSAQATRERFACDLAAKIRTRNHRIHIHNASRTDAESMNDLLWTFRDISFLPHSLVDEDTGDDITLGWDQRIGNQEDVLINMDQAIPGFADKFARIVEIVPQTEPGKREARERYRQYRDAGFELHNHDISDNSEYR